MVLATPTTYKSSISTSKTLKTSVSPGPAAGTYIFHPTSAYTYQKGQSGGQSAGWRSSSDDYYHGNGSIYGSTRGAQYTYFFFGSNAINAHLVTNGADATAVAARVSKIEIYMKRATAAVGSGDSQRPSFAMHTYGSKPSTPSFASLWDEYTYTGHQADYLSKGEGNWYVVPPNFLVAWRNGLVGGTYDGVVWGDTSSNYMQADRNLSAATPNGTVRITLT
ncbi:hypothetical protein UFOVP1264_55 [uncultured Caudovirales phage]|uniref:Uncharacterized protein n=1 Tax=uncultured Caudovirales phage TaxID=2100421 RepID=A0A6J5RAM7_9CAUD|nr:hypothetical protein UFOVP1264_55 [uncultured Caudovirales phage]